MTTVPPLLQRRSSDEYRPLPWRRSDLAALELSAADAERSSTRLGMAEADYAYDRRGTAATLRSIDQANGGGFYSIDAEAAEDADAAAAVFGGREPVVDVQTHLIDPGRWHGDGATALAGFLQSYDPDRWPDGVDPRRLDAAAWASLVFGASETAVALLTSTPGPAERNVLTNEQIASAREVVDRYAGSGRVLTHTIVHPNEGSEQLESMPGWDAQLHPSAWKVYTMFGPPTEASPSGGWFLDDPDVGFGFLERVRASTSPIVAAHKGIGAPIPSQSPPATAPRDIGPAAVAFPDVDFIVYHSGYEPNPHGEEGAHDRQNPQGVGRLVATLERHGLGPGDNVYAELGSTWYLMLRRPHEAAHVLGKLLACVGYERIIWGTDSTWYGSPQPLIDAFRAFTIPPEMQERYGYPALTAEAKEHILSLNARRLYGIADEVVHAVDTERDRDWVANASVELRRAVAAAG